MWLFALENRTTSSSYVAALEFVALSNVCDRLTVAFDFVRTVSYRSKGLLLRIEYRTKLHFQKNYNFLTHISKLKGEEETIYFAKIVLHFLPTTSQSSDSCVSRWTNFLNFKPFVSYFAMLTVFRLSILIFYAVYNVQLRYVISARKHWCVKLLCSDR